MKLPRRKFLPLAGALALAPALLRVASALDYPTRPITIIVPFPAGGPVDTLARLLSEPMRIALGQPLSPDQLRLMFTPDFGMFIAPGCNGIRGAVTMGLIALIAGYIYRFRWYAHVAVVAGRCCWDMYSTSPGSASWFSTTWSRCASPGCAAERRWATILLAPASFSSARFCSSMLSAG